MSGPSNAIALFQLPMYDWPENHVAMDRLATAISLAAAAYGLVIPRTLDRSRDHRGAWTAADLGLSQTCGLPLVTDLKGRVSVLGSFSYSCSPGPPGSYDSVIIARRQSDFADFEDLRHRCVAINSKDSYSGCLALQVFVAQRLPTGGFFGSSIITGSHRNSIHAVASGEADTAAIDCVSWEMASTHVAAAEDLLVLARTASRPGLPLITATGQSSHRLEDLRSALARAVQALGITDRERLGLTGFVAASADSYAIIADDLQRFGAVPLITSDLGR